METIAGSSGRQLPAKLFGYDIVDFIGEGAGSLIYVGTHPLTGQIYAIKHVERKTDKHVRFLDQLRNEFEVARHFSHEGLRRAIEMKENRTLLRKVTEAVLVMEMFDGTPVDLMAHLDMMQTINTFIQVAHAIGAMHAMGFVHCDLKPNNILLNSAGMAKVIDFGQTCKVGTVKERIQGTPDYIAPEQVKRDPVTVRTDVFNFGATLYWATAGRSIPTLFTLKKAENSFLVDERIPSPRETNSAVPETLSNLVMECVRTNPSRRPTDMSEVARRLEIIRHGILRDAGKSDTAIRAAVH